MHVDFVAGDGLAGAGYGVRGFDVEGFVEGEDGGEEGD